MSEHADVDLSSPDQFAIWASAGRWRPFAYQRYLGGILGSRLQAGDGRIIVNAPPRHGKSDLISFWTPAWMLRLRPTVRIILASYGSDLAAGKFGRDLRNLFLERPELGVKLSRDSYSSSRWRTDEGGGVTAVGVGGPITGLGADLLILDDPIKNWDQACGLRHRQRLEDWFNTTFYTRAEPGASIVVNMTRWHEEDLTHWLMNHHADLWEQCCLQALAGMNDPMGRAVGEPLCPERFSLEQLDRIRKAMMRSGTWDAMYQQEPLSLLTSRVYQSFSMDNVDESVELDVRRPLHLSLDFNMNPGVHACLGQYEIDADLFTVRHVLFERNLSIVRLMEILEAELGERAPTGRPGGFPIMEVFGDASGNQRWTGDARSCYQVMTTWLVGHGWQYRLRVPRCNPSIRGRVEAMNQALRDPDGRIHYRVHPSCKPLLADFREMQWDASGKPAKDDARLSHASDAEGYRVHMLRPIECVDRTPRDIGF